jgi:hypothetical protein
LEIIVKALIFRIKYKLFGTFLTCTVLITGLAALCCWGCSAAYAGTVGEK